MSDVTQILSQIESGDSSATDRLFPLVYDELRKLAAVRMAHEKSDQTLQATALVHEVWMKMVGQEFSQRWESRRHFFGAACESMRRILVDKARSKSAQKRGGEAIRESSDVELLAQDVRPDDVIAVHDALEDLAIHNEQAADLV